MNAAHEAGAFVATAISNYVGEAVTCGVSYAEIRNASAAGMLWPPLSRSILALVLLLLFLLPPVGGV